MAENRDRVIGQFVSLSSQITVIAQPFEGFPAAQPAFYELYNTKAQILARTHPRIVNTQKALLSFWHASDPNSEISLVQPISYFDRLRIREPGSMDWSLGPHIDGGGTGSWEDPGYRSCYARIFEGGDSWKEHDPYDATPRVNAQQNLYASPYVASPKRVGKHS